MKKPLLVILAAGIGSRYGGLKQMEPVGPNGEIIIDYSIYDALEAGFQKVVFIIKHEIEDDFKQTIGARISPHAETAYAFQELDMLPHGHSLPHGRVKPWGTTHALLCAKDQIDAPFAVINADDYYGASAYKTIYDWLSSPVAQDGRLHYAMVGYRIENTVTENGGVTRGVCESDENKFLTSVTERYMVEKTQSGARFSEDKGTTWQNIPAGTLVSMNFWGFHEGFFAPAERHFKSFLDENIQHNPLKCEDVLPVEVDRQIKEGTADVKVLESRDLWHGITYKEDRAGVARALAKKHADGEYPANIWK